MAAGALDEALDEKRWTPLHWAASKGHVEAITALVAAGEPLEARAKGKATPLHLAAAMGHPQAIKAPALPASDTAAGPFPSPAASELRAASELPFRPPPSRSPSFHAPPLQPLLFSPSFRAHPSFRAPPF